MIDRANVIKGVHDARRYFEDREWVDKSVGVHIDALNDALAMLKEQEPLLCKDCKYFNDYFVECEKNNHTHGAAWYCGDGERAVKS